MKCRIPLTLLAAALLVAGCATVPRSDLSALQGTWQGPAKDANPPQEVKMIISGNNYEFHSLADSNVWYKGTFTLREDTNPRQFIAVVKDCPFPQYVGKSAMAIYSIENGVLKLAGNEPGKTEAPASFDAPDSARVDLRKR